MGVFAAFWVRGACIDSLSVISPVRRRKGKNDRMTTDEVTLSARFLAAYDAQLRNDAETPSAIDVTLLGPLRLVTFSGGRGFITYPNLGDANAEAIRRLVPEALNHFSSAPDIFSVEWKTRGHDLAPGLHEALIENGFVPDEPETIMVGEAAALAVDVALSDNVVLRQVTEEHDVRAMSAMQDEVFGDPVSEDAAQALLRRIFVRHQADSHKC